MGSMIGARSFRGMGKFLGASLNDAFWFQVNNPESEIGSQDVAV